METDKEISVNQVILKSRDDWATWIIQLRIHAQDKSVWHYINPDGETALPINELEPPYPFLPKEPIQPASLPETATAESKAKYDEDLAKYYVEKETYDVLKKSHANEKDDWTVRSAK